MSTPTDPRLLELQVRKAAAEVRKAETEALTSGIAAQIPPLPKELPVGKLAVPDHASPLGVVAAYAALGVAAGTIVAAVLPRLPADARLWIVADSRAAAARDVLRTVESQLGRFGDTLRGAAALLSHAPAPPPSGERLPSVTKSAVPLLALSLGAAAIPALTSFLTTDTTVRDRDVTVTFRSLAAAVTEAIGRSATAVVVDSGSAVHGGGLITQTSALETTRDALASQLAGYRSQQLADTSPDLAAAVERLAALKLGYDAAVKKDGATDLAPLVDGIADAARAVAALRQEPLHRAAVSDLVGQIIAAVDAFLAQLRTADPQGESLLTLVAECEANQDAHLLLLEPAYAGAESVYVSRPLRATRGTHLGAVAVSYSLARPDGAVLASGVVTAHQVASTRAGSTTVEWQD